jgi:hypothetical protein
MMASLADDIQTSSDWISRALTSPVYSADFSRAMLKDVDRFCDEHSKNGRAKPGGLLSEQLGQRMFALGSYVGEVIRRAFGGRWQTDDADPQGEINVSLILQSGGVIWPVQRVMKRFKNGPEDGIYAYGCAMGEYSRDDEV